jgi:triosephosphate isomerase
MNKKLIVGNWKMNPSTLEEAKRIYRSVNNISKKLSSAKVVICPPFVYIKSFISKNAQSSIIIGAQDVFVEQEGSFTGEVSISMLKNLGVEYVIVGHSERRKLGETDEIIARKVQLILDAGIKPILCIGEEVRDINGNYLEFVKNQIKNSLNKVSKKLINNLIIAYEPIWAIGALEAMAPADIHEMSLFVRKVLSDLYGHKHALSTQILYGGNANFRNVAEIIKDGQVNGLLLGRASINSTGFVELLKTVDSL